jgi:WD40 repeat protein
VKDIGFMPCGRQVLSAAMGGEACLSDVPSGEVIRTFAWHAAATNAVSVSGDGRFVFTASDDGTLKVWNTASGACESTLQGHDGGIACLAISADCRYCVTGGRDHTVRQWILDWDLELREQVDWDPKVTPYLDAFLALHTPYLQQLAPGRAATNEDVIRSLTRSGRPRWTEAEVGDLLMDLGRCGYGWLRPSGVERKLAEMAGSRQAQAYARTNTTQTTD